MKTVIHSFSSCFVHCLRLLIFTPKTLVHPRSVVYELFINNHLRWLSDRLYLKLIYWLKMHEKLDFSAPKTFCQKIQWLKINDRNEEYSILVDKYRVKECISRTLGPEYVIPLLAVYDCPEDIDFNLLPYLCCQDCKR